MTSIQSDGTVFSTIGRIIKTKVQTKMREFKLFLKEIRHLLTSRFFLFLTIIGNGMIGLTGLIFYYIEKDINPKVNRFMDAVWWSFATATTTGYGDITPVSDAGKILSILLMLAGLALFSMYTALFAETILTSKSFMVNNKRKD